MTNWLRLLVVIEPRSIRENSILDLLRGSSTTRKGVSERSFNGTYHGGHNGLTGDRPMIDLTRRTFLQSSAAAVAAGAAVTDAQPAGDKPQPGPRAFPPARTGKPRRRLAVVTTAYHYLSHAYHICGRFLHGYLRNGRFHHPDWAIAGMYVDQPKHTGDLSRELVEDSQFFAARQCCRRPDAKRRQAGCRRRSAHRRARRLPLQRSRPEALSALRIVSAHRGGLPQVASAVCRSSATSTSITIAAGLGRWRRQPARWASAYLPGRACR